MSAINFADLIRHVGHEVEVVTYGDKDYTANVSAECMDCSEVLIGFDREVQHD
jgi:hypothetical protein